MGEKQTEDKKMPFWGVGPMVQAITLVYAALAGAATYAWPEWFAIHWLPYPVVLAAGIVLVAVGLPFQAIAGCALMKAYHADHLVTTGVYAICRNPLYANIILTLLPGLALLCRSWLMLTASLVAYVLTRRWIRREETYLEKRFGQPYLDYCRRTNAIFPMICRR
ncbi:MAG: isoprenylcysteine carboxylmethyltransferase family protein [Pirellulales bacterium]|nr:isoprenylcysteine carboxylmethyltransferase family protein [Pirellulales bacterium]